ncbi:MAG: hypothetical protein LAC69_05410, partial [Chlorobium sp.]|nr:hypothetical protein [Chlorobium sp.]
DQYYSGIYRTTTNTKLKQSTCSGHAIHPRPEGRGFPRIFDKTGKVCDPLPGFMNFNEDVKP